MNSSPAENPRRFTSHRQMNVIPRGLQVTVAAVDIRSTGFP